MNTKQFYVIKSKQLASSIHYLGAHQYFIYEDKEDSSKKVYSFEDTPDFRNTLSEVNKLRNNLRKLNK